MAADGLNVFVSYRRSDCQAQANGLHDGLSHRLPSASLFMDVDSIPYGVDFADHIRSAIESCDVVLVLIGDNWLDEDAATGRRRIDESDDFVRLEVENALKSPRVRVIPVLVEGASMPRAADLPRSISKLSRLNAIELSDQRWKADLERLARLLDELEALPLSERAGVPQSVGLANLDGEAISAAVRDFAQEFQTKDVSEHPDVLAAHGDAVKARNYHAMVGTFVARNAQALGVRSAGKSSNGRGERWQPVRAPEPPPPPAAPPPPLLQAQPPPPPPAPVLAGAPSAAPPITAPANTASSPQLPYVQPGTTPAGRPGPSRVALQLVRALMVLLPILSFGLAAWVPPVWAASKTDNPRRRLRLRLAAVALAVAIVASFVAFGAAPSTAEGSSPGPWDDVGGVLFILVLALGTWLAVANRNAGIDAARVRAELAAVPGVQGALTARQTRAQYRELATQDPGLAREMALGRPDLGRSYDDGGLLDINALGAFALMEHGLMTPQEAHRTIAARERLGRLSSVDDLVSFADVGPQTVERLRDRAIFL